MNKTLVILVVGLSSRYIGPHTPHLQKLAAGGGLRPMNTVMPAVTCSVQSTLVTGLPPSDHGAVANGWFFRELSEVLFWRQSNHLVTGEKIWDAGRARNPNFTCAKMFWWYNMYSTTDWSATPRPLYPADGRKIPDHYTHPLELHDELDAKLGRFPLFKFWGPLADISSSDWITKATLHVMDTRNPTLTLTYLPHLDYNLQRLGPDISHPELQQDLRKVDALCGNLISYAEHTRRRVVVVSEYGITPAREAVHLNRALRNAGLISVRPEEYGREILDVGASQAFAVVDHQIAHVYLKNKAQITKVRSLIEDIDGIDVVWDEDGKRTNGLSHPRSGDLIAVAKSDRWFSYYYWLDDAKAPDFARTVDIHRKPGYDPMELFFDPEMPLVTLQTAWKLAKSRIGFRQLLDVISLKETNLVKGTHGRITDDPNHGPLLISSTPELLHEGSIKATDFKQLILDHVFA